MLMNILLEINKYYNSIGIFNKKKYGFPIDIMYNIIYDKIYYLIY